MSGAENLTFAIVVHAATVLSTLCVLRHDVSALCRGAFSFRWTEETKMLSKIIISMIPVGIVGLFFKSEIESFFSGGLFFIGVMWLLTASLLIFSHFARERRKSSISFFDAFIIGLSQAIAVLPGLSRSGTTIATGMLLGNKRESVAKFSFLMVIIPILGEVLLDLFKGGFSVESSGFSPMVLLAGFLSAFVTGLLACHWMIRLVTRGRLIYFAYYCIALGITVIIYTW
jgi:undecaprenyl-diphosphatase